MGRIHPSAVVSGDARLAPDVLVGPFVVVERGAVIGPGCRLEARVVVKEGVALGPNNVVCEGAVLGGLPQHLRAGPRAGRLRIGPGNTIRENVTIHRALAPEGRTEVGAGNLIMVNAHIAHDCRIGDRAILANNVMLAGHVTVEDGAYLSGAVAVHQFCRIGRFAMVGGQAHVNRDVPPFVTVDGLSSRIVGLNVVGLRRNGFGDDQIRELKDAYRVAYRSGLSWSEALAELARRFPAGPAAQFAQFLRGGTRGFLQERRARAAALRIWPPADEASGEAARRVG